jgi:hypothetical protein
VTLFPADQVAAAYRAVLPWSVVTGLIATLIPGPGGQQIFLVIGATPFLLAAAARGLGLHTDWSAPALAVHRAFTHLTSFLVLVGFTGLAAAVGATAGAMLAELIGLRDDQALSVPGALLAALPILWRYWPAATLAYAVPQSAGVVLPGRRAWRGPRYGDARRLSRSGGDTRQTAVLLVLGGLWAVLLVAAGGYRGEAPLGPAVRAASYVVFLPLLTAMALVETRRMLAVLERA